MKQIINKYLFFCIILLYFFALTIPAFSQPKMEIEGGLHIDAGTITRNSELIGLPVYIENKGTETLKIFGAEPSCGCMRAPLEKDSIEPGERVRLNVLLKTDIKVGSNDHIIVISTNDPENPVSVLHIISYLTDALKFSASYLYFDNLQPGEKSTKEMLITNNTLFNIQIFDYKTVPESLRINRSGSSVIKPGESLSIVAEYTPDEKGYFQGYIHFKTDQWQAENLKIRVLGRSKQ